MGKGDDFGIVGGTHRPSHHYAIICLTLVSVALVGIVVFEYVQIQGLNNQFTDLQIKQDILETITTNTQGKDEESDRHLSRQKRTYRNDFDKYYNRIKGMMAAYFKKQCSSASIICKPGRKGDKGSTGRTGRCGAKGKQGARGQKGERGRQGSTGSKGPRGSSGSRGSSGRKGCKGAMGPRGPKCTAQKGERGQKGARGTRGSTGAKGKSGSRGSPGSKGDRGSRGGQGRAGKNGAKGSTGQKGCAGRTGSNGGRGPPGDHGPQGVRGDKGQRGQTGAKGQTGRSGRTGDKGNAGPQGKSGPRGPQGPKGDAAPNCCQRLSPPTCTGGNTDVSASIGDTVTLSCRVTGFPTPTVAWFKDGQSVHTGSASQDGLVLTNVQLHDSGIYVCKATNVLGSKSKVISLTVRAGYGGYH